MKSLYHIPVLILVICGIIYWGHTVMAQEQPSVKPKPATKQPALTNPNQEINDQYLEQLAQEIAGRENEPAEKVFKNIQLESFKNVPAGRLLRIMNFGYSRALGVACTHCHVEQDFASNDKRPKRAAREMATMHRMINDQLAKMEHLGQKPEKRFVNCSTCHRGSVDPMQ